MKKGAARNRKVYQRLRLPPERRRGPAEEQALVMESRLRSKLVLGGLMVYLGFLGLRAGQLMMWPDDRLAAAGVDLYDRTVEMHGRRGSIVDAKGRLLASTVDLPTLYANPSAAHEGDLDAFIGRLASASGKSEQWLRERFAPRADGRKLVELKLGDSLEPAAVDALIADVRELTRREHRKEPPWLFKREEAVRLYPGRDMAAPLLGYTDSTDAGAAGIEKLLEKELTGDTYRIVQGMDRKGRSVEAGVDETRLARAGHSVRLTLDGAIQHAAESALDKAMITSMPESAMAVVMDVHTGSILAMATRPGGNANDGASRVQQELFKNRPAMDQIEPGSVFKPFIAAAALEEGLVTPETMMDCELGHWTVSGKVIKDDHPKGIISVTEVIKYSSNIGAAKLGFMLGAEREINYLRNFGFGHTTGLSLPGEVAGSIRRPDNIRPIELATTSFGQGVTASPVQLVSAVATIANGGERMFPRIVDAVLDRYGEVEVAREARVDRRVISPDTAVTIARMMETVTEDGGTGTRARVDGYRVAGKTGTAQKVENGVYSATKRISSFVGFLPADRPEIAIAVVVDTPSIGSKYGGIVAAPVFSEIGAFTMRYLSVLPEEVPDPPQVAEAGEPPPPPPVHKAPPTLVRSEPLPPIEVRADGSGGWILPDLGGRSMRSAAAALQFAGVDLVVEGAGHLVSQEPLAGAHVAPGETVTLHFN